MKYTKRKQPLRIRNDSYKHWMVKSVLIYELERLGHEVEIETYIPRVGYCDLIDRTTWIQYEIDGNSSPQYRWTKAKKYMRPGIRDIVIVPIFKLSSDIKDIREYVQKYIVPD
ncbi:MAG: hypothetical protein R6V01_03035 [Thermoplasmatota archaeon]